MWRLPGVACLAERDHVVAVGEIIAAIGECLAPVLDAYRGLNRATGNLEQVAGGLGVEDAQRGCAGAPVVDAHRVETSLAVRTRTAEHAEGTLCVMPILPEQAASLCNVSGPVWWP